MDSKLLKYYYNPETGFLSATKLYKKLKEIYPQLTLKHVKDFINKQYTAQLNKPIHKPKVFSSIFSPMPKNNYQLDIMVYDRYAFNGYKYIIVVIDVYSRFSSARAMTSRKMKNIIENIEDIFQEMGVPNNLNCDNEFNKKDFNELMQDLNVSVHYSEPNEINKNAIVERFNRTLELLQKWRIGTNKYDWEKVLPMIIKNYNNTYHSTIKETPFNLFNKLKPTKQNRVIVENSFKVGDKVRTRTIKKIFDKNDILKYSKDIYIINKINKNKIYLLNTKTQEESDRTYKPYELKLINEIQYISNIPEEQEEKEHKIIQVKRKTTKSLQKEGISEVPKIRRTTRQRRPVAMLVNEFGEHVKY